jgi:hypothetical protein
MTFKIFLRSARICLQILAARLSRAGFAPVKRQPQSEYVLADKLNALKKQACSGKIQKKACASGAFHKGAARWNT